MHLAALVDRPSVAVALVGRLSVAVAWPALSVEVLNALELVSLVVDVFFSSFQDSLFLLEPIRQNHSTLNLEKNQTKQHENLQ